MSQKQLPKSVTDAISALDKRFGEKVVMRMSDAPTEVDVLNSGRPDFDIALGGGYGLGKIIEIFGPEASGKTGLMLELIAETQKAGGLVAMVDAEHALNTEYAQTIGVEIDDLLISQPSYGEQAIETIRSLISTEEISLIVVDSVAALIPKAELDGESGEAKMGLQARMMGQAMRMISGIAAKVGCTVAFTNQLRDTMAMYGPAETTTGGRALKFAASQRIEVRRKEWIKEGEEIIGFKQFIKVVKNKIGVPFKSITNDIIYGIGVDTLNGTIESLIFNEIIVKKGAWYAYEGTNIANGKKNLSTMLRDNPELLDEMVLKLKEIES